MQSTNLEKEIKYASARIIKNYKPEKVILFGSLAYGKATLSSDIDMVIIKKTHKNHWERLKEADRFISHDFPIDILVYTPKEISERLKIGDTFVENFINRGRVIYEK
ncbi:MAG: DNA polymerase beta domain-containing protein region [Candidatus Saganbacteria bacterium]|uniref:DNA polymerase beta domain-containing protein region n=1 Tax=Candidatus Saganbacteria bacterium TaxID=2575572 RepID=A0A833L132_UNCSA|nr:MAG: DNA polymerase beta domain-containing protein region [Candidatus Saganbacteria bacterium]